MDFLPSRLNRERAEKYRDANVRDEDVDPENHTKTALTSGEGLNSGTQIW